MNTSNDTFGPQKARPATQQLFKPLTLAIILIVGIFCFGAFLTLSGFANDLKKENNGRAHAASKSPNGFAGIVRLLKSDGMDVELLREDAPLWDDGSTTVYTIPSPFVADKVGEMSAAGAQLFVLPKWRVGASRETRGEFVKYGTFSTARLADIFEGWDSNAKVSRAGSSSDDLDTTIIIEGADGAVETEMTSPPHVEPQNEQVDGVELGEDLDAIQRQARITNFGLGDQGVLAGDALPRIERLQTFQSERFIPILRTDEGIVLGKLENEPVYVLADPDLWNNYGVYDYDVAIMAQRIATYINGYDDTLYFDLSLHGLGTNENFLKTMLTPPFLAATLCLLITGGLIGWSALTQFGAPASGARAYALGKGALADNSADLITVAGREPMLAGRYAALMRSLAAKNIGAPRGLSEAELISALDRIGKRSGVTETLSDLTRRSDRISQNSSLMAIARALHKWKQEITHDRK